MTITNRDTTKCASTKAGFDFDHGPCDATTKSAPKRDSMQGNKGTDQDNGSGPITKWNTANACTATCNESGAGVEGRVESFDHVTFWVGNAKQSAVFYMTQFGFRPFAFRGLETGSRDLACHVVKLNDTIIQFVSALEPGNEPINKFLLSHGDAVRDVAFRVSNIEKLLEHALGQGAELVHPLEVTVFDDAAGTENGKLTPGKCFLKRATIRTFGDVTHTFVERNYEYEIAKFLPGYKKPSLEVSVLRGYITR